MPGPTELCILVVLLLSFAPSFVGVVDAARKPDRMWMRANQNKVLWVVVLLISPFVFPFAGVVTASIYFGSIRPKLRRVEERAA